jgi:hypothetical protein
VRVAASNAILDRALGKPVKQVDLRAVTEGNLTELSDAELDRLLQALREQSRFAKQLVDVTPESSSKN